MPLRMGADLLSRQLDEKVRQAAWLIDIIVVACSDRIYIYIYMVIHPRTHTRKVSHTCHVYDVIHCFAH